MKEDTIREALDKLDPKVDAHWTKGGLPDLNAMRELAGEYVSRADCTAARPGFCRSQTAEPGTATPEGTGAQAEPKAEGPTDPAPEAPPKTSGDLKAGEAERKANRPGVRFNWD